LGNSAYQLREAATELNIKNVFDAFRTFIMRQRVEPASK
jgi:hypothetical protein